MIAARVRWTRSRVRMEARRVDRRTSLMFLVAILVVFASTFAIGRATTKTIAASEAEPPKEHLNVPGRGVIPTSLSAVPAIATLISLKTVTHPHHIHSPAIGLPAPIIPTVAVQPPVVSHPRVLARTSPTVSSPLPAPSHVGGGSSTGTGGSSTGTTSPPSRDPSHSHAGESPNSGAGGSFDSSG
jgi:hypothetical protein